jgi:hypothetical protein
MATEFTYESRVTYLDPDSDLKTVTGSYVGPNEILICVQDESRVNDDPNTPNFDISEIPDTDADLSYSDLADYGDAPLGTWVKLEKTNPQHIILMDMIMNCAGHVDEWQTEDIHTYTFDDGTTYVMQYRNPVNDNTLHTFDMKNVVVDPSDGTITFPRFEAWTTNDEQIEGAGRLRAMWAQKYIDAVSDDAKAATKKLLTVYEHIENTLGLIVPPHKIDFPSPADILRGSTY